MNKFQKAIKVFAICLAIIIIANIFTLIFSAVTIFTTFNNNDNKDLKEFNQNYKYIESMDIDIVCSSIEIVSGNEFKIESTTKNDITCKEVNGRLKIEENNGWFTNKDLSGKITIYVPETTILEEIDLDTGAGEIKLENINARKLDLDQGAGIVKIINSKFEKTDIDGGAGKIEINSSKLNNLELDCGAGKVEVESEITGNSKISAGIGEIDIILLGDKENYNITAEKGIGNIKIENQECNSNTTYGIGNNKIKVEGGIGNITIEYKDKGVTTL